MSSLPLCTLSMVQSQFVGLTSGSLLPVMIESVLKYGSTKWNVVNGFSGTPAWFRTKPPVPAFVEETQSPTFATGEFAIKLPSIAKLLLGTIRGATPAGGAAALRENC